MVTGESHSKRGKFALIKTPEGILAAKEFSILISSKQFKTILFEEPERGMHPQFVERMVQIMKQEKNNKRVILTTHQKGIVTPWTIPDTFIFRRSENGNQIISGKSILNKKNIESMKNMRLLTSHNITDIFFARKVLFYEGDSEELFLRELKSQILAGECSITANVFNGNKAKSDEFRKILIEYTFIKMNGKGQSELYHKISGKL
jgi:predicted ATP-dependent endonuclease of OLD family